MSAGDLGEALYRAIARTAGGSRASMKTEPSSFAGALRFFVGMAGGNVSAAARLAGIPRRSFRDWMAGTSRPGKQRQGQLVDSARMSSRRDRLTPRRENKLRASDADVVVKGSYNYDDGGSERAPIRIGDYLDPGTMDAVVDIYLNGGDAADMRERFAEGITDPFYSMTMALSPNDEHGWTVSSVTY